MLVLFFTFYSQKYHRTTWENIPISKPTNNSILVCDFMYSRDEATNPTHTIESATLFASGNSNNVAKPNIKVANELIPIMWRLALNFIKTQIRAITLLKNPPKKK